MNDFSYIFILLLIIVVFIVILIVLYLYFYKNPVQTTSISNPCQSCDIIKLGCINDNVLEIKYSGTSCTSDCINKTVETDVVGCVAPVCNSGLCTFNSALFTNLKDNGTLYTFCDSGTNVNSESVCSNFYNSGINLSNVGITLSYSSNNIFVPIFITTIYSSVYNTVQPIAPTGINQSDITVNMIDPTIVNDPYMLYMESDTSELKFLRLSYIRIYKNINNCIWIYDSSTNNLKLYSDRLTNFGIYSTILNNGNEICGKIMYSFNANNPIIYDGNSGKFNITQKNLQNTNKSTEVIVIGENFNPTVDLNNTCNIYDSTRWYSISASNPNLL